MPKSRTVQADAIEQRRVQVANLILGGMSQRAIAQALNVSVGTVNSDIKALRKDWAEEQSAQVEAAKQIDIRRAEAMIRAVWLSAKKGDVAAVDRVMKALEFRKSVFGYAAPEKHDHTTDGQPLPSGPAVQVIEVVKNYADPTEAILAAGDPDAKPPAPGPVTSEADA